MAYLHKQRRETRSLRAMNPVSSSASPLLNTIITTLWRFPHWCSDVIRSMVLKAYLFSTMWRARVVIPVVMDLVKCLCEYPRSSQSTNRSPSWWYHFYTIREQSASPSTENLVVVFLLIYCQFYKKIIRYCDGTYATVVYRLCLL